jgi:hypothetical protein
MSNVGRDFVFARMRSARDPKGQCVTDGSPCHQRSIGSERTEKCMNADKCYGGRSLPHLRKLCPLPRGESRRTFYRV